MTSFYSKQALDREARSALKSYRERTKDKKAKLLQWMVGIGDTTFLRLTIVPGGAPVDHLEYINVAI